MKLRTTALLLALSLSVSLLSACGGQKAPAQGSASENSSMSTPADQSGSDVSTPDVSTPDVSTPDISGPSTPDVSTPDQSVLQEVASLSLNKTDFTMFKSGETYQLEPIWMNGGSNPLAWSSSDETVATVSEDGTVTAIAPGVAIITASSDSFSATCTVRCNFEMETDTPDNGDASAPDASTPPSTEDLSALYVDAINNCGNELAQYNPAYSDPNGDGALALEMVGLTTEDTKNFAISFSMMNVHAYCISVIMPEDGKEQTVIDALNGYISRKQAEFERYLADQYEIALNAKVETLSNGTVIMVMCQNQDDALQSIKAAIEAK